MADPTIAILPPAPLYALEIWSRPHEVAARIAATLGLALPAAGRSATGAGITLARFEPTVWLAEGDVAPLADSGAGLLGGDSLLGGDGVLGGDGALTAIGGGIVRVRLAGAGWRGLLMAGGQFDAESPAFAPGCCAATIVDHVAIRLRVESADSCLVYVPASYARDLVHFWEQMRGLAGG